MREVEIFADSIAAAIEGILPQSVVSVKVKDNRYGNSIFIQFKLWEQSPNNISQNDPSYTQIWINDSHTDDGSLRPDMSLEMSMGNKLRGYNAVTLEKRIGFRGVKSGDSKKVLRALTNYFKKLDAAAKKHQVALSEALDRYRSQGSIRMGSLRSLEMRIARLEKLSSMVAPAEVVWNILYEMRRYIENEGYGFTHPIPIHHLNFTRKERQSLRNLQHHGYVTLNRIDPTISLTKKGIYYINDDKNNPHL